MTLQEAKDLALEQDIEARRKTHGNKRRSPRLQGKADEGGRHWAEQVQSAYKAYIMENEGGQDEDREESVQGDDLEAEIAFPREVITAEHISQEYSNYVTFSFELMSTLVFRQTVAVRAEIRPEQTYASSTRRQSSNIARIRSYLTTVEQLGTRRACLRPKRKVEMNQNPPIQPRQTQEREAARQEEQGPKAEPLPTPSRTQVGQIAEELMNHLQPATLQMEEQAKQRMSEGRTSTERTSTRKRRHRPIIP